MRTTTGIAARTAIAFVVLALPRGAQAESGSADLATRYLESSRYALAAATDLIRDGVDHDSLCVCGDAQSTDNLCLSLRGLTEAQRDFCRRVIIATAASVGKLNKGERRVPLAISADPLYVADPFGNQMEVTAGTDLGPAGPIIASYDHIRTLGPMDLLALLGHEFHHKAAFPKPETFITDNDPIGPFTQPGGGRTLLDAVGAAVAWYAYEHQLIGREVQVADSYTCEVTEETTGIDFFTVGESARIGLDLSGGNAYETGVGNWPTDLQCALLNDQTHQLLFRVKIHESKGCNHPAAADYRSRWTRVELWQIETPTALAVEPKQRKLASRVVYGWNPLCDRKAATPLALDFREDGGPTGISRHYQFKVQYVSSADRTP